jgi:hypothetical protein
VVASHHFFQPRSRDMSINFSRGDVGMAQHFLHCAQIGAVIEQMRRKGMA